MAWGQTADGRIWRELRGDEDPFEGMGDQSFRTRSSVTAPIFKSDPFNIKSAAAAVVAANNEVAVIDDEGPVPSATAEDCHAQKNSDANNVLPPPPSSSIFVEDDVEDWSDVSI